MKKVLFLIIFLYFISCIKGLGQKREKIFDVNLEHCKDEGVFLKFDKDGTTLIESNGKRVKIPAEPNFINITCDMRIQPDTKLELIKIIKTAQK